MIDNSGFEAQIERATSIGFHGMKELLVVLNDHADVFPPLKVLLGAFLALIEIYEVRGLGFIWTLGDYSRRAFDRLW